MQGTKEHNPLRTKFTKLPVKEQLKAIKLFVKRHSNVLDIAAELTKIDPFLSVHQDGRIKLISDKHLLKN